MPQPNGIKNNRGAISKEIAAIIIVVLLVGFLSGWFLGRRTLSATASISYDSPALRSTNASYRYISPLLSCSPSDTAAYQEYQPLRTEVVNLISKEQYTHAANDISVYFRDLNRGRWVAINENTQYYPASLLKVPVMMAYYKLAEVQPDVLQKRIFYDGVVDDNAAQTFKPKKSIAGGKSYTVDELINDMIIYSDNNAAQLLFDHIDHGYLDDVFTDLGLSTPQAKAGVDFMSVKSYSYFFRVLYNATYLNRKMSEKAMTILLPPDIPNGLRAGIPSDTLIAQKFGEADIVTPTKEIKEFHDCGIVYQKDNPYLLCVMTRGDDFGKLAHTIQDISRLVYNWISAPSYDNSQL